MSVTTKKRKSPVKGRVETIVASGTDVRPRVAELVAQQACENQESKGGLVGLVRTVIDGAQAGLTKAVPQDRDDVLRQVVDALGDGLSQAALAGRLAVQEATGASRRYTKEDLSHFRDELSAVRDLFTETVAQGLKTGKALTEAQVSAAVTHAKRVADRLGPAVGQALAAAAEHPVAFAREGIKAGVSAGQAAAGSLFQALGHMLDRAGAELRGGHGAAK
jgi:hypothetical protein